MESEEKLITCLRCRRCRLLPSTDMTAATPVVWCEKKQDRTPLILSGCALAKPYGKWVPVEGQRWSRETDGDMTRNKSEVEKAYLRARYGTAPIEVIMAHTMRSHEAVLQAGQLLGLTRPPVTDSTNNLKARQRPAESKVRILNEEQKAFIANVYMTDAWPVKGGHRKSKIWLESNKRRSALEHKIAELGHPFKFNTLTNWAYRNLTPTAQRKRNARQHQSP